MPYHIRNIFPPSRAVLGRTPNFRTHIRKTRRSRCVARDGGFGNVVVHRYVDISLPAPRKLRQLLGEMREGGGRLLRTPNVNLPTDPVLVLGGNSEAFNTT